MNIAHIINSKECGGLERLTFNLALKLKKRGHNVVICCLESGGQLDYKDLEIVTFNKQERLSVTLPLKLASFLHSRKIAVVHTHNPGPLLYGTIAGKLAGIPALVNTRHGRALRVVPPWFWNMNDAIVTISNDAKVELVRNNKLDSKKVITIYNGIDISLFPANINVQEEKHKLNVGAAIIIGTVARLSEEKDQATLIKAFAKILKVRPHCCLVFVGEGNERFNLERLASELGVRKNVLFLGYRKDVDKLLKLFDVFVLSSLQEGVSLSLLEAMASKKPVVATSVGGNKEVVVDKENGFLVPANDVDQMVEKILVLVNDMTLAVSMGMKGREIVERKFNIDTMTDQYVSLYSEILKRNNKRTFNG